MVSLVSIYFLIWALSIQKVAPFVYIRNLVIVLYFPIWSIRKISLILMLQVCIKSFCVMNSKDVANKPEKTNKTDQFPAQVAGPGSSGGKRVKTILPHLMLQVMSDLVLSIYN